MSKMPAPPEAKFIPLMLWFVRPDELFTRERKGGGLFLEPITLADQETVIKKKKKKMAMSTLIE